MFKILDKDLAISSGVYTHEGVGRFYRVGDLWVPSVTTITKQMEDPLKFADLKPEVRTHGCNRGTVMHGMLEEFYEDSQTVSIKEKLLKIIEIVKIRPDILKENISEKSFDSGRKLFMKIWEAGILKRISKLIASEMMISNKFEIDNVVYGYAGRFDCVGVVNGFDTLIDFKSSTGEKTLNDIQNYFTQIPAYVIPYQKQNNVVLNAEIWIASERTDFVQVFELTQDEIQKYYKQFENLVVTYYTNNKQLIDFINNQLN
jgi:hypothetical protein